ncbi:MAG: hypothetical protein V3V08_22370 [Nannocystaceae bacterium]
MSPPLLRKSSLGPEAVLSSGRAQVPPRSGTVATVTMVAAAAHRLFDPDGSASPSKGSHTPLPDRTLS